MTTLAKLCLRMFLRVVSVGVSVTLILHVDLLSLVSHDKHLGELVLDDDPGGVECHRL
jgi:hypothetical protein